LIWVSGQVAGTVFPVNTTNPRKRMTATTEFTGR
jgi:hypothetical protein